jgi:hypothetical protein
MSMIAFTCIFGGALLGIFVNSLLPEGQTSSNSRDVVRLTMGLVATTAALALGRISYCLTAYWYAPKSEGEVILDKIQELSPKNDTTNDRSRTRPRAWLGFEQKTIPVPGLLMMMLIAWLTVLFVSFGVFGPRNPPVLIGLFVSALAASGAIFLILEMYHPDAGLLKVSDAPLRAAMAQVGH